MQILLVDDNVGYLKVLGDMLRDQGYEVILAEDGKQARETIEMQSVDLIISDVFMPTLDGVWFHSYVRDFSTSQDVPFVFISGSDDHRTRELIVDPNIDFFISKTAPVEELLALVESFQAVRRPKSA